MSVVTSGIGGSSMYENGYNVQIPGSVTGTAVTENPPGAVFRIYGFGNANGGVLLAQEVVVVLYSKLSLTLIKPLDNVYLQLSL